MSGPFLPPNPLELIKQQLGLSGASGPLAQLPLNQRENQGLLDPGPTTSSFVGPATGPLGASGDSTGILQKLLQLIQLPAFQQTGGAIASAIKSPRDLRAFQQQTEINRQGEALRQRQGIARSTEARAQKVETRTDRQAAIKELNDLAELDPGEVSLEEFKANNAELFERIGPSADAVYRRATKRGIRARKLEDIQLASAQLGLTTAQINSLAALLIDNAEAEIPSEILSAMSPESIALARSNAARLKERRDLDDRDKRALLVKNLTLVAPQGSAVSKIDIETGDIEQQFTVPVQRAPTAGSQDFQRRLDIMAATPDVFSKLSPEQQINFLFGDKLPTAASGAAIERIRGAFALAITDPIFDAVKDKLSIVEKILSSDPEALALLPSIVTSEVSFAKDPAVAVTRDREKELRAIAVESKNLTDDQVEEATKTAIAAGVLDKTEAGIIRTMIEEERGK